MSEFTHIQGAQCDCPSCRQSRVYSTFGQQSNQVPVCDICGRLKVGPNTYINTYQPICTCTPAELQQLTEADVRRIIREEIAKISVQNPAQAQSENAK